jgi:flagellar protein FlaG
METGSIGKPLPAAAPVTPPRTDHLAAAGAVKTELAPEASVQQAEKAQPVRFEPSSGVEARAALEVALDNVIERTLEVDSQRREVIYRAVDQETGEVVQQLPDETVLRLRTYLREMRELDQDLSDGVTRVEKIA